MSPACRRFEICHREATHQFAADGQHYCYLHYPEQQGKNIGQFEEALRQHLGSGSCDLRFLMFPAGIGGPNLAGRTFVSPADLSDAAFGGSLNLTGAVFERGLRATAQDMGPIILNGARINSGGLYVQVTGNTHLVLQGAVIQGAVDLRAGGNLEVSAGELEVYGALSVAAATMSQLLLPGARLHEGFKLRVTRCDAPRTFSWTLLTGDLDWRNCTFIGELNFDGANFDPDSQLDLTQTRMGGLRIVGHRLLPRAILVNSANISGDCRLEADLGEPRLKLRAPTNPPQIDGTATFTNVELGQCLLVGNAFQRMTFSNVEWARSGGRWVLFDEMVAVPKKGGADEAAWIRYIPWSNIREAYQILKEYYRNLGDHVRSGDFHYGEMEMKRREHGSWFMRWLGLEALYCYLSGYGTRWKRALLWLGSLILVSAGIYYLLDAWAFSWNFGVALKYSLDVATLQRPELPRHVSRWSHWVRGVETVWGPVQIALFGLALRMRLRR